MSVVSPLPESFPVAVVLSAYHNRLLIPFPQLRAFLDYMCGQKVFIWEIPRARSMAARHLERQYPWLATINPPQGFKNDAVNTNRFVRSVTKAIKADELTVYPLPKGDFIPISGITGADERPKPGPRRNK